MKQVNVENESTLSVDISKQAFMATIASEISKAIIKADYQLFALYPKNRDLESIFNQLNNEGFITKVANREVSDAA